MRYLRPTKLKLELAELKHSNLMQPTKEIGQEQAQYASRTFFVFVLVVGCPANASALNLGHRLCRLIAVLGKGQTFEGLRNPKAERVVIAGIAPFLQRANQTEHLIPAGRF